jgi:hypothetical protein
LSKSSTETDARIAVAAWVMMTPDLSSQRTATIGSTSSITTQLHWRARASGSVPSKWRTSWRMMSTGAKPNAMRSVKSSIATARLPQPAVRNCALSTDDLRTPPGRARSRAHSRVKAAWLRAQRSVRLVGMMSVSSSGRSTPSRTVDARHASTTASGPERHGAGANLVAI